MNKKLLLLATILTVAEAALVFNIFYPVMSAGQGKGPRKTVPGQGAIKGINTGIYSDLTCTTPVQTIHWGLIEPGAIANQTVYVRNEGDAATTLTMTLSNWTPADSSNHMSFNWNYAGQTLDVNQVIPITFTLLVSEDVHGISDFSFDITIG